MSKWSFDPRNRVPASYLPLAPGRLFDGEVKNGFFLIWNFAKMKILNYSVLIFGGGCRLVVVTCEQWAKNWGTTFEWDVAVVLGYEGRVQCICALSTFDGWCH